MSASVMIWSSIICSLFSLTSLFAEPLAPIGRPADYPLAEKMDGPASAFTDTLINLTKNWPSGRDFCEYQKQTLEIQMVRIPTADRPYYVGFKKCMGIHAPFAAVAQVLDGVDHYQELFPGDKKVTVLERDRNKTTLSWERKIPVFFVPNVRYQMNYLSVSPNAKTKMYRSQLKKGDRLRFSDAIVVIESLGPNLTLYSDYEFYEADFGLGLFGIKAVGSDQIWKESLQGSYLSLLAIRFKAEHLDWDYNQVSKASQEAFKSIDLNKIASESPVTLSEAWKE